MNPIKMNRVNLLNIVKENKEKHVASFNEAVNDYLALVLEITEANLKIANTQSMENFKFLKTFPPAPVSYEDSYKRAIRMLELSIEDVIEINESVFNQLVLDEWDWKRSFIATSLTYKAGAPGLK